MNQKLKYLGLIIDWVYKEQHKLKTLDHDLYFHDSPLSCGMPRHLYNKASTDLIDNLDSLIQDMQSSSKKKKWSKDKITDYILNGII